MKKTDEYYQALEVCNNAKDYHNMDVMVARTYVRAYDEAINYSQCCTQLLCLNTHETWDITEGKIYNKEGENQREYIITDDKGKRAKYFKRHFEEVQN